MPPKKKVKRNLAGLRNQSTLPSDPSLPSVACKKPTNMPANQGVSAELMVTASEPREVGEEPSHKRQRDQDMLKPCWEEYDMEEDIGEEQELDEELGMDREGLQVVMMMVASDCGDDPRDEDWVPPRLRWKKAKEYKGHPETYIKGPDVWSKLKRSYYRYCHLLINQMRLEDCGFEILEPQPRTETSSHITPPAPTAMVPSDTDNIITPDSNITNSDPTVTLLNGSSSSGGHSNLSEEHSEPPTRKWRHNVIVEEDTSGSECESKSSDGESKVDGEVNNSGELQDGDPSDGNSWEEEIDEVLIPQGETRSWQDLHEQIKNDLKNHYKTMALTQINQLMILRNFATLQIRGMSHIAASLEIALHWHEGKDGPSVYFARCIRALAWHYQTFEQLPKEH